MENRQEDLINLDYNLKREDLITRLNNLLALAPKNPTDQVWIDFKAEVGMCLEALKNPEHGPDIGDLVKAVEMLEEKLVWLQEQASQKKEQ